MMQMQPGIRSPMIKNLVPGLTERGKIKIGVKGQMRTSAKGNEFQPPQKLDHFIITTLVRDAGGNFVRDDAMHAKLGGDRLTRIPVRLLYDDPALNFQSRYVAFKGKVMWCTGDGESASRLKGAGPDREPVPCTCPRQAPEYTGADKCKINGVLAVMIDGAAVVGGVWKLRTTSYNSVVGIMSSLALIQRISGGRLAGLPLDLTLQPKTVTSPTDGKVQTVYVVGLEYRGTVEDLQQLGYELALKQAQHHVRIEHVEREARLMLAAPTAVGVGDDDPEDVVDEFYPQAAAGDATVLNGNGSATTPSPPASKLDALEELIGATDEPQPDLGGDALSTEIDPDTGEILDPEPARDWPALHAQLCEALLTFPPASPGLRDWIGTPAVVDLKAGHPELYADLLGRAKVRMKAR